MSLALVLLPIAPWIASAAGPLSGSVAPPDAVIERWEQTWDMQSSGELVYHELRHVRLNSDRAYGEFADPRIPFHQDTDTVTLKVARTRRPDGSCIDVPDYSRNVVSPGGSAWPAFAGLRQLVVTMSGIEPGCVVELEYEVRCRPGKCRPPSLDLRLDHRYPITTRVIRAIAPEHMPIHFSAGGRGADAGPLQEKTADGRTMLTWVYQNLPANPDEPQAPPWQRRCPRLALSFEWNSEQWLSGLVLGVEGAARSSDQLDRLAKQWTQSAVTSTDKVRAIQEKLSATFNFVEVDVSRFSPMNIRPADEVLRTNYGTGKDATAMFLTLVRQAGVDVRPALLVRNDILADTLLHDGMVADTLIAFRDSGGQEYWSARHGRIARSTGWAGHSILTLNGSTTRLVLPDWGDAGANVCEVSGRVALDAEGRLSGKLTVTLSGMFVSTEALRTREGQRERLDRLIGKVMDKAAVGEFTVTQLADGVFSAVVDVKSSEPTSRIDGRFYMAFGADGPSSLDAPLPLAQAMRRLPVWLPSAFEERINVTLEWPDAFKCQAQPGDVPEEGGDWGRVWQAVSVAGRSATYRRTIRIDQRELDTASFAAARRAINVVRGEPSRVFLIGP